ncbi:MAG: hypothetical protein ACI9R3_004975 [Verrucomicrobiales bacterium]|jgi:hypothetical protein
MKHKKNLLITILSFAVALAATSQQAEAQGKIVSIGKVALQSQKTPDYQVSGPSKKRWTPKEWIELEVPFSVKLPGKMVALDSLSFKYYVVLNGPKKTLLTATLNHSNVPGNEKIASVVYISPQTIQKIANSSTAVSGPHKMVVAYGVEVEYNGATVGFFDSTGAKSPDKAFWTKDGLERGDGLVSKKETPFAPLWSDYHAEVR